MFNRNVSLGNTLHIVKTYTLIKATNVFMLYEKKPTLSVIQQQGLSYVIYNNITEA